MVKGLNPEQKEHEGKTAFERALKTQNFHRWFERWTMAIATLIGGVYRIKVFFTSLPQVNCCRRLPFRAYWPKSSLPKTKPAPMPPTQPQSLIADAANMEMIFPAVVIRCMATRLSGIFQNGFAVHRHKCFQLMKFAVSTNTKVIPLHWRVSNSEDDEVSKRIYFDAAV